MKNLLHWILVCIGIVGACTLPFCASAQTKNNPDLLKHRPTLIAPMPVYEAEPDNEAMKDRLLLHNGDSVRLAHLAKWKIVLVNDTIEPHVLIVKVIDTTIPAPATYPMMRPMQADGVTPLAVREEFCAACHVWLRPNLSGDGRITEMQDIRFVTNSPAAEVFMDDHRYEWVTCHSADFTFEVHEQDL